MRTLHPEAWVILLPDEQQAIILQHGHNKSSWQAGEMLDKSHYKYLEIKYRAEKFLKMFTEHLELFDTLIPVGSNGSLEIKHYFQLAIEKRMKPKDIYAILDLQYGNQARRGREKDIIEQMDEWLKSDDAYNLTLFNLIKEFDRWNNFRILPKEIQEPSAFNRRVKNIHKKHLKVSSTFPDISVPMVEELFGYKKGNKVVYLPLITDTNRSHVIKLRYTAPVMKAITELNLYLFKDKQKADEYLIVAKKYLFKDKSERKCKDGLEFWPKYRQIMKLAENYMPIQNLTPSRKFLIQALEKLQFY